MSTLKFDAENFAPNDLESALQKLSNGSISKVEVQTKLPGIFSADPKEIPNALQLKSLDYNEACEIVASGISPVPLTLIRTAQTKNIPVHITSSDYPENDGTVISNRAETDAPTVKAISLKGDITLVSLTTSGMWHQVGFLADFFAIFKEYNLSVDQVSTSENNITITLDKGQNSINATLLKQLETRLQEHGEVTIQTGKTILSLIGNRIKSTLHKVAPIFELFIEQKIYMLSHSSSDINFGIVVDTEQSKRVLKGLHENLFKGDKFNPLFGPSLNELSSDENEDDGRYDFWWKKKESILLRLPIAQKAPATSTISQQLEKKQKILNF